MKSVAKEDITKRLVELEEKEMDGVEEVKEGEGRGGEEEEGEEKEEEDEEEEDEDEEMDAGTDYISSYFDNGEGYLDDDDDADDGPTY
ncbi:hypothetical protein J437_LFUL017256 [Ladona fulva]|uniref:DNA-directed RNA polymerase III subunit n=1 Tax=Ladona fulva TaxID=123851 RepID=A0A8K0KP53_LADFU|nr:hypothetical protein J437_LFUL017256 [Ladona fulva]